jgi:hypothetical protein
VKVALLIAIWIVAAVGGMGVLLEYKQTPGPVAETPPAFPAGSAIKLDKERPTLVMLIHPRCPCSRASVSELDKLLTRVPGKLKAQVVVVLPEGLAEGTEPSALATRAAEIKGVEVLNDPGGLEAHRFGSFTSGQTYLFSPAGELLFSGGITPSRGHQGDNFGSAELERLALSHEQHENPSTSKVFGCALNSVEENKQ